MDKHSTDQEPTRQRKWAERNPLKRWAHSGTASAVRRGLLVRQPCRVCGDPNTDAHHPDHRDPLSVEWLCRAHHKAEHKRLKAVADGKAHLRRNTCPSPRRQTAVSRDVSSPRRHRRA